MSAEMSSSAALPWCWLILLSSAPFSINPMNVTLLFNSSPYSQTLRNCSCSAPIQDCNEHLANSLCQCHTVLRSSLSPRGLRAPGPLHVWFKELWVLEELLNASTVSHLSLSFCGAQRLQSQQVLLLGLRTLRIHCAAPGASYPNQEISMFPTSGAAGELQALSFDLPPPSHISLVDVEVLNGLSALKAYTVVGPPAAAVSQHFPLLVLPFTQPQSGSSDNSVSPSDPGAGPQRLLFTFVY